MNKLDFRDPLQCVKSCFIFGRKLLLQMQNEHFTTTFCSKRSSGHKDLAEQMQNRVTTSLAQRAEELGTKQEQVSLSGVRF